MSHPSAAQTHVAGVILAGGGSTRMGGGDKGLISLNESTMLDHVISRLKPQVSQLIINANGEPDRFARFGVPVVPDGVHAGQGPLSGVLAGLDWASRDPSLSAIVTVASDTPFLPDDLVARLLEANKPFAVAASQGRVHPTIGLWPLTMAGPIETELSDGKRQAQAFVRDHGAATVNFGVSNENGHQVDPFFNANTPEDLDWARRILQTSAP